MTLLVNRSVRCKRWQLTIAELHQSSVIGLLSATGHQEIAQRLKRCQHDRQHRRTGQYPWRCGSAGCWACRRNMIRRWWLAFSVWIAGPATTIAVIPMTGDLSDATRRLRKALRDSRDRVARYHRRWQSDCLDQARQHRSHRGQVNPFRCAGQTPQCTTSQISSRHQGWASPMPLTLNAADAGWNLSGSASCRSDDRWATGEPMPTAF
jgi:hypothetical protein